tara:strand:- start:529 stop:2004 length:1476 start_codon:yes stop_codon:yes gene_type:complete
MATSAQATGYLELNIEGFDKALKTARNLMVTFAAGFGAFKLGEFFKDGITGAVDFGKEMQSASRAMGGFDPGALLITQKALEKIGMGAEEARGHIGDFISEGRNISEIFGGADNYAAALKSAAKDYGSQADVLTKSGEKLQSVFNTMESVGAKVQTFFLTATEQFILPLQSILNILNETDLASVGKEFGEAIAKAATILLGLFKNGDMMETLKLGLIVAFQEGVNYFVGGIKYVAALALPLLGKAFTGAMELMGKAFNFIFSGETFKNIGKAWIGIAMGFHIKVMEGMNKVVKFLQAGIAYAIQTAVEKIPGLSSLLGEAETKTFGEFMDESDSLIPPESIAGLKEIADGLTSGLGTGLTKFIDGLTDDQGGASFKKADLFEGDSKKKLQDLLSKGLETGTQMNEEARKSKEGDEGIAKKALNTFSGSSSKVITDSLAKVGGGGGFLRAGMNLQEKSAMQTALATKQTAATLAAMHSESKKNTPKPTPLKR